MPFYCGLVSAIVNGLVTTAAAALRRKLQPVLSISQPVTTQALLQQVLSAQPSTAVYKIAALGCTRDNDMWMRKGPAGSTSSSVQIKLRVPHVLGELHTSCYWL
jgi:hypothetical protein